MTIDEERAHLCDAIAAYARAVDALLGGLPDDVRFSTSVINVTKIHIAEANEHLRAIKR